MKSMTTLSALLVLVAFANAAPNTLLEDEASPQPQTFMDYFRTPRWMWDQITSIITPPASISERVSQTFTRNSFDQALQVLSPSGMDSAMQCATSRDSHFKDGLCLRVADCLYYGGTSQGGCAGGIIGSCCVFEKRCDSSSSLRVTEFTNPRYPTPSTDTGECKLTINPMNNNVCQYRLDFEDFSVANPAADTECTYDFLSVYGGSPVPRMCGDLKGQHVYTHVKPGSGPITVSVDRSHNLLQGRSWHIKITQIECNSPQRAPDGCVQFYNTTSGQVRSFNYQRTMPNEGMTRQIKNQQYGVCINSKVDYCTLTWTAADDSTQSFSMSGDSSAPFENYSPRFGLDECQTDFVTIPGGRYEDDTGAPRSVERICGTRFPKAVITSYQPYRLYVNTDSDEVGDTRNSGFALNFRHALC